MKKEIIKLVNSEEGTFRLNNISRLRRWTTSALNEKVDCLFIEFDNINHVHFGLSEKIESRDYDGIIAECQEATTSFLTAVALELNQNMENGYRNKW